MKRFGSCLVMVWLACSGCGGSVTAPDHLQQPSQPAADVATISGQVYASNGPADPAIENALLQVNEADGSSATVMSGGNGHYAITVKRGSVTITASKEGYEAKQWQFDLLNDTVLNFGLDPQ